MIEVQFRTVRQGWSIILVTEKPELGLDGTVIASFLDEELNIQAQLGKSIADLNAGLQGHKLVHDPGFWSRHRRASGKPF